ncbi:MAG: hypothetical protein JRI97_04730 [Deltaproteobacteria bacterium]|nr:hypothetical protein [Deltaproteobacteria bacterium]
MIRILPLTIVLVALFLVSPAYCGMTLLDDEGMEEIEGQVGISIDINAGTTQGYMIYGDTDGIPTNTTQGYLNFGGLTIDNGVAAGTTASLTGVTLDLGTTTGITYLVIGASALSGRITFNNISMGDGTTSTAIGTLQLGDIQLVTGSTVKLFAH